MPTPRLVASTATLLTAALLTACSGGAAGPAPSVSRTAAPAPAAYPQPTIQVTPEQARIVTMLGQRNADGQLQDPVEPGMGPLAVCRGEDAVVATEGRAWASESMVPDESEGYRPKKIDIARAFNGAVVLDDSPSAVRVMDERLARWSSCEADGADRITREKPSVTGAARAVGVARDNPKRPKESRYWYFSAARTQNLLVLCETAASTAESARETSLSCLREMSAAASVVGHPLRASKGSEKVAARAVLAGLQRKGWEPVLSAGSYGGPCPSSDETFLPLGAASWVQEEPKGERQGPPVHVGIVSAKLFGSAAQARAQVARARTELARCKRSWIDHPTTYPATSRVDAITGNTFGDGGTTVAWQQTFLGATEAAHLSYAIFTVDRVVVFSQVFDAASAKEAAARQAQLAAAVVARVRAAR